MRSQLLFDVVLALILAGIAAVVARLDLASTLAAIGLGLALAFRRVAPGVGLAAACVIAVAQMSLYESFLVPDLLIPVIVYATSAYGTRRTRRFGLAAALIGALVGASYLLVRLDPPFTSALRSIAASSESRTEVAQRFGAVLLVALAGLLLPWLAGLVTRARNAARASSRARLIAERDAAQADRAVAVEQERLRIAREMHDIVGHSLAVVIAQADGARYALRTSPDAAEDALSTIASTSRRALGDVRAMLAALRHEDAVAPSHDASDLARLIVDMRDIGLQVRLRQEGDLSALPTSTQLAVYRIVQEGLTNAMKHGRPSAPVELLIDALHDPIRLDIVNDLALETISAPGTGHGLIGMRERVSISGGQLTARREGARFRVSVTMPHAPQPDGHEATRFDAARHGIEREATSAPRGAAS